MFKTRKRMQAEIIDLHKELNTKANLSSRMAQTLVAIRKHGKVMRLIVDEKAKENGLKVTNFG